MYQGKGARSLVVHARLMPPWVRAANARLSTLFQRLAFTGAECHVWARHGPGSVRQWLDNEQTDTHGTDKGNVDRG